MCLLTWLCHQYVSSQLDVSSVSVSSLLAVSSVCVYLLLGCVSMCLSSLLAVSSVCACLLFWLCHQYVPVFSHGCVISMCLSSLLAVSSVCACLLSWLCHQYVPVFSHGCHQYVSSHLDVSSVCVSSLLAVSSACVYRLRGCVISMCLSSPWLTDKREESARSVRVCIFLTMSPVCVCVFSFAYRRVILCLGPVLFLRPWW